MLLRTPFSRGGEGEPVSQNPTAVSDLCGLPPLPSLAAGLGVLREGSVVIQLYHSLVNTQNLFFSILNRLSEVPLTCEVHFTLPSIMAPNCRYHEKGKSPHPYPRDPSQFALSQDRFVWFLAL